MHLHSEREQFRNVFDDGLSDSVSMPTVTIETSSNLAVFLAKLLPDFPLPYYAIKHYSRGANLQVAVT
jgi:hypothetical protein